MSSLDSGEVMDCVAVTPYERDPKQISMRACEECKRKKTKCDMRKPTCSNCGRHSYSCVFPTSRKRPVRRKKNVEFSPLKKDKGAKLDRLLQILDNDAVRNLLSISHQRQDVGSSISSTVTSPVESNSNGATGDQTLSGPNTCCLDGSIDGSALTTNLRLPDTDIQLLDTFNGTGVNLWYRDGEQPSPDMGGTNFQDFTFEGMGFLDGVDHRTPASIPDIHPRPGQSSTQHSPVDMSEGLTIFSNCADENTLYSLSVSASTADQLYVVVIV